MNYDYSDTVVYLLDWYDCNARILAWRENPIPYYVWISEIMLQQTRVEAVKLYFDRFVTALPDVEALATVDEEKLMKLWEGLGYYTRVRNLQKAAQIIMKDYNGVIPADYEALLKLPGIGSYTAGAIASIAYGIPRPAVDGNVLRVMKRVAGSFDDITKASVKKGLEQDLLEIMPSDRPGDFNQSLMELGATVCIPNGKPLCDKCPIMHLCTAFHTGTEMKIPVKPDKKSRKIEHRTILLFELDGNYLIRKRDNKGLLAGMWEFPSMEGKLMPADLEDKLLEQGVTDFSVSSLGEAKHIFSHIEWHMIGYKIVLSNHSKVAEDIQFYNYDNSIIKGIQFDSDTYNQLNTKWVDKSQIKKEVALPTAFEAYKKCIE